MIPFHSYIFKIASRCNLNCSYCYVYNLEDNSWQQQPKFISEKTFRTACIKIREHCQFHSKNHISIAFHGGEPLLIGVKRLHQLGEIITTELVNHNIKVDLGIQTNGLLFTEEIGDFFLKYNGSIGVSIDGPPEINDLFRVDHNGKGSSKKLEKKLALLTSEKYRPIFRGILGVINVNSNPVEVLEYFMSFNPPMIDLLFPDDNYDRRPNGKETDLQNTKIAEWLNAIFDNWFYKETETKIRVLENIVKLLIGGNSNVESIGTSPVDFIFIEANGDIEILDTLKSSFNGATKINHNVFNSTFNDVAENTEVVSRQLGIDVLCETCKQCSIVNICGGGYLPNRYSTNNKFDNPSVYCADLKKIISHIDTSVAKEFGIYEPR